MIGFKLNKSGDIDLSSKDLQLTQTIHESLSNRLRMRFGVWSGEWLFDTAFGTPYKQRILSGYLTKHQKDAEVIRICYQDSAVKRVVSIESQEDPLTRSYIVSSVTVATSAGEERIQISYSNPDPFEYPEPQAKEDLVLCRNGDINVESVDKLYKLMNEKLSVNGEFTWWTTSWK